MHMLKLSCTYGCLPKELTHTFVGTHTFLPANITHIPDANAVPADHLRWPSATETHDPAAELAATHAESYEWAQTGEQVEGAQSNYSDVATDGYDVAEAGDTVPATDAEGHHAGAGNESWSSQPAYVTEATGDAYVDAVGDNGEPYTEHEPWVASNDVDASNAAWSSHPVDTAGTTGDAYADGADYYVPKEEGEAPADGVKAEDSANATEAEGHDVDVSNASSSRPADVAEAVTDETGVDTSGVPADGVGENDRREEESEAPADGVKAEDATATDEIYRVGDIVEFYIGDNTWVLSVVIDVWFKAISNSLARQVPHYTLRVRKTGEVVDELLSDVVRRAVGVIPPIEEAPRREEVTRSVPPRRQLAEDPIMHGVAAKILQKVTRGFLSRKFVKGVRKHHKKEVAVYTRCLKRVQVAAGPLRPKVEKLRKTATALRPQVMVADDTETNRQFAYFLGKVDLAQEHLQQIFVAIETAQQNFCYGELDSHSSNVDHLLSSVCTPREHAC